MGWWEGERKTKTDGRDEREEEREMERQQLSDQVMCGGHERRRIRLSGM